MAFEGLRALSLGLNFAIHGVAAVVRRPYEEPIETRVVWITPVTDGLPAELSIQRGEPRRVAALRRDQVPSVPQKTRIEAPEQPGAAVAGWIVDGVERVEADHVRVFVLPDPHFEAA